MKRRNLLMIAIASALVCTGGICSAAEAAARGNPNSRIYHLPSCAHYNAKGSTAEFKSAAEAEKAGYKACKQCGRKTQGSAKGSKKQ